MRWKDLSVRTGRMVAALAVASATSVIGIATTAAPAHAAAVECRIVLGDDGASSTIVANLNTTGGPVSQSFANVTASSFVRSTTGPCTFQIYNSGNFTGDQVTLGSGITTRIRAGLDGVSRKDSGGGETWRVRSVFIVLRQPALCTLRVGHTNGVQMDYYSDANSVPAQNRVYSLTGCSSAALHANQFYVGPTFRTGVFSHAPGLSFGFSVRSIDLT